MLRILFYKNLKLLFKIIISYFALYLVILLHGFALLPFLLLVFRFSSWFVPLFGYPIYGRRVGGQASVAKERG